MAQPPPIADVRYLGPVKDPSDPEIVIDCIPRPDEPLFADATAAPIIEPSEDFIDLVTKTYTVPPPPDSLELKRKRKKKALKAGLIGAVIGLLIGGPIGALLIGFGSAHVAKRFHSRSERQVWEEYDKRVRQQADCAVTMYRHVDDNRRTSESTITTIRTTGI
jgi:hypothetical protein